MSELKKPIVQMKGIGKLFGPVRVLEGVDFDIYPGEVHVLAGENGAGKSTLIKILSGIHLEYEGEMLLDGMPFKPNGPIDAKNSGISVIHQELSIIGSMSVASNMFVGNNIMKHGLVDVKAQNEKAKEELLKMDIDIDVTKNAEEFSFSLQQLMEICKATSTNAKVIIMDEPSSALNSHDVEQLFSIIAKLKEKGCGIVYISHKMEEIERLADRITVLRDGKLVGSDIKANVPQSKMIKWMVGREIIMHNYRTDAHPGEVCFSVKGINVYDPEVKGKKLVDNVSFEVRKGEVLGVEGLQGSGASEMLQSIFGVYNKKCYDTMTLDGKEIIISNPIQAIENGIGLITNDRKGNGIEPYMDIVDNTMLAAFPKFIKKGLRDKKAERRETEEIAKKLNYKIPSFESMITDLSGGNQQKVLVGKWLKTNPRILLLDEPTKGIDVGAKEEIYKLINSLTEEGISVVLITSEMPEMLSLSDRIIVLHRGKITAEFAGNNVTQEELLEAAMGREK